MADQGKHGIAWTETTWNPIRGCSRVNSECVNCYAEDVARRFSGKGKPYEGLVSPSGKWNGKILIVDGRDGQRSNHLTDPLRWTKPKMVFVNSMSDMFHEHLPFEEIDRIVAVMAMAPQHTFQVLTKRSERMLEYLTEASDLYGDRRYGIDKAMYELGGDNEQRTITRDGWPLPNVWWGVSAGTQKSWDEHVSRLQKTPAAVRWVSVEPQLESITPLNTGFAGLHWLVIGGESGAGARPFHVRWAEDWIACAGDPLRVFVKQLGSVPLVPAGRLRNHEWNGSRGNSTQIKFTDHGEGMWRVHLMHKGGEMGEWPKHLRVREYPK